MELVSTMEINGEEREIADAVARGKIDASNVATVSGMSYSAENDEIIISAKTEPNATVADRVNWHNDALNGVFDTMTAVKQNINSNIDVINSNLDTLEFGEVAGGKNLFNQKCLLNATYDEKTYTITVSGNAGKALDMVFKENTQYTFSAYVKQSNSSTSNRLNIIYTDGTFDNVFLFEQSTSEVYKSSTSQSGKTISEVKWIYSNNGTATFRNFQIEEGTTATPYEPYIPSVKMLADEVSAQKNDLGGLSFSVSGTTLSITDGTNTWTLSN